MALKKPEELCKHFLVAMIGEANDGIHEPLIFSGFIVDVDGIWFWITASHCSEEITKIAEMPDSLLGMVVLTGHPKLRFEVGKSQWQPIDFRLKLKEYCARHPNSGLTKEDIELFDLSAWIIPDLARCYLLERGVVPVDRKHLLPDIDQAKRLVEDSEKRWYVAGIPQKTHSLSTDRTITFAPWFVPLHPNPDTDRHPDERRVMYTEGHYWWIPSWMEFEQSEGGIRGMSGGPVVLDCGEEFYVLGIATQQDPAPPFRPKYIGVTSAYGTLLFLEKAIMKSVTSDFTKPA